MSNANRQIKKRIHSFEWVGVCQNVHCQFQHQKYCCIATKFAMKLVQIGNDPPPLPSECLRKFIHFDGQRRPQLLYSIPQFKMTCLGRLATLVHLCFLGRYTSVLATRSISSLLPPATSKACLKKKNAATVDMYLFPFGDETYARVVPTWYIQVCQRTNMFAFRVIPGEESTFCCWLLGKHLRILHAQTDFYQIAFQPPPTPSSERSLCIVAENEIFKFATNSLNAVEISFVRESSTVYHINL